MPPAYAVISDEVSQDLTVIRAFVRKFRLSGIELRSFAGRAFKDLTPADVRAVARAAKADGWKVCGCATPVFKCDLDDRSAIRRHRAIFQRSLDVARALNCDLVRVFTFLRQPDPLEPKRLSRVARHLAGLLELARGSGVRIGVENEHSCLVATADEMLALLTKVPAEIGVIWDPCNVFYVPNAPAPSPADIVRLAPRLLHVHAKDAARRSRAVTQDTATAVVEPELAAVAKPIGAGEVDWSAQLKALRAIKYKGVISLETHWRQEALPESLLHLPAGEAFSHGGDEASRICLTVLKLLARR